MGLCYENGRAVSQDYVEAVKWYSMAAERGYADAEYRLGICYEEGRGVPINQKKAVQLYTMAAEHGNENALLKLKSR